MTFKTKILTTKKKIALAIRKSELCTIIFKMDIIKNKKLLVLISFLVT